MIRFAAVLSVVAAPLWAAPVCEMRGAEPVEIFETAKAAFLVRDFGGFMDAAPLIMTGANRQKVQAELDKLNIVLPEDFESCQTVMQRRDAGGLVQEVTTFNMKGHDFPLSVYLQAMPVRGEMSISYLGFHTTLGNVLNFVK